jgi:heat shock protein HslJ
MNKGCKLFFLTSVFVLTFSSCAGGASSRINSSVDFADIQQKTWALAEIQPADGDSVFIDRQRLKDTGNGDAYTLIIDEERISGKANPNRYFTSYELGEDHELSLFAVAGTLMWGIIEPGILTEQEYYAYLQEVNRWDSDGETLELTTVTPEYQEVFLIYKLVEKEADDES